MMLHLSDEEHALYEKMRKAKTQKEIDEIRAKLKEIWDKQGDPYKDLPFD